MKIWSILNTLIIEQPTLSLISPLWKLALGICHLHPWMLYTDNMGERGKAPHMKHLELKNSLIRSGKSICKYKRHWRSHRKSTRPDMTDTGLRKHSRWETKFGCTWTRKDYKVLAKFKALWYGHFEVLVKLGVMCIDSVYPHICAITQQWIWKI